MLSFSLQLLSKTFLIVRRIQGDNVINVKISSCKVVVILVEETKIFSTESRKILKYQMSY